MASVRFVASACALAALHAPAFAASDAELAEIRSEIRNLKSSYEARIQALEQRLKEAEARAAAQPAAPAPVVAAPAPVAVAPVPVAPVKTGAQSSLTAFNPAISAILNGRYTHTSRDPSTFTIPGFSPEGEVGPGRRGFSLGESELVFSASVDPLFDATLNLAVTPEDTVEVEEAYGRYLGSSIGLTPKFGRFRSGIGYLNEQHAHAHDFADVPLAYEAFLGGHYATDGVQLKWVAPTELYMELGGEVGNGDAYPGSQRTRNGAGAGAAYAHAGGDIGDNASWRAGVSHLRTRSSLEEGEGAITGAAASRLTIADFVWKYAPRGNPREGSFKLQGEYFDGRIREAASQSGWYLQGVWQFHPEWRVGARYDQLDAGGVDDVTHAPKRASAMVDWNPSEFSRLRLQFSRSELAAGTSDNQWVLQYILSLGAHGAHKY
jgi:hypothetical protein